MRYRPILIVAAHTLLSACATEPGIELDSARHLSGAAERPATPAAHAPIPEPLTQSFSLAPLKILPPLETYSVVVSNVRAQELLFSLARDAKLNLDIHPGISGHVTLNALDQTLPQLLTRISKQVDMRFELDGNYLSVMPDTPFLRIYRADYVNMSRDTSATVSVSSQIAAASGSLQSPPATSGLGSNSSSTVIISATRNRFWDTLIQNLKDLLRETDKVFPEGAAERTVETVTAGSVNTSTLKTNRPDELQARAAETERRSSQTEKTTSFREAAAIIANPETGVISIRATSRQHEKVQEFLGNVLASARRQVLIEATIAEVELSQNYQKGIDWRALNVFDTGFRIIQSVSGAISGPGATLMELGYNSSGGNFGSTIKLLESFGTVRILSSPKISALNNQTAVIKIVDNAVYFTIESATNQNQSTSKTTYSTSVHTVPIGFVMNVTPQIADNDSVLLNIRPSLSRAIGDGAVDPNPDLKTAGIINRIPVVRSRELESVMRVSSGNIAIMGGLMEDLLNNTSDAVPGLVGAPVIGSAFENRNDLKKKTELIIFVRPTIIHDGDPSLAQESMPGSQFFSPASSRS
jgi:MSHA biogenesis protein MshL